MKDYGKGQMNKADLINFIAQKTELTKKKSGKVVNAFSLCMLDKLAFGE
ncbi:protein of unknown function [Ruminococcaceae bacterium BL-4]|jgi:nucleoid DNA-binding protein|nr:protein of unknown function [Ruminococcaceae bacterium BL-4]